MNDKIFNHLSPHEKNLFDRDGFVIRENVLTQATIELAKQRMQCLFDGEYLTGVAPDEVNWRPQRDPSDVTRQICNAWKSDPFLAQILLDESLGEICARLMNWPGTRINQDNIFWKPPHGKAIGFHQDSSYEQWVEPPEMVSCWIALDDTSATGGTVEYVRGSHRWALAPMSDNFHAPSDPLSAFRDAAKQANESHPEIVAIEVPAGSCVFHHGCTWHGSRLNTQDISRRSIVAHCMSSQAKFSDKHSTAIYSRYKRFGDTEMDESFFPILWREDGYRSVFLQDYLGQKIGWGGITPPC